MRCRRALPPLTLPALPSRPAGASTLYALLGILLLAAGLLAVIMPYKVRPADPDDRMPDQGLRAEMLTSACLCLQPPRLGQCPNTQLPAAACNI